MPIRILAVGKKHEPWVLSGIERYQKRLKKPYDVEWILLPHSVLPNDMARQEESGRILSRLGASDFIVLLDERGKNVNSINLSELFRFNIDSSRQIIVIIGGAFGVNNMIHQRADFVWSLSKLVFPHQLVRLILTEQIYRSQEIANNKPYHHT